MKSKQIKILVLVAVSTLFASCTHRMVGTWTVLRSETKTTEQQGVKLNNIGTMEFNKDGSGKKNLTYSLIGVEQIDQSPFKWTWKDGKYISIESEGSDLSKTWIIIENKRKYQKWNSTDGAENVQILELKK